MSNSTAKLRSGADPQYAVDAAPPKTGYLGYPINVITRHKASRIVQDLMTGLGLNTAQLAVLIGVSASLISRWRLDRVKVGKKSRAKLRAFAEYINNNGELGPDHIEKLISTYGQKWSHLGNLDPEIRSAAIRSAEPPTEEGKNIPQAMAKPGNRRTSPLWLIAALITGALIAIGVSGAIEVLWQ
tara:strand:- start:7251 stop:7805 length:555 start_codon:yes stop_codon:yes gene_type:complete